MMNFADLVLYLVCGLAIPLAVAASFGDGARQYVAAGEPGKVRAHFALQWFAALLCGPGLLVERLVASARDGNEKAADILLGAFAAVGWAMLYGYVLLGMMTRLIAA